MSNIIILKLGKVKCGNEKKPHFRKTSFRNKVISVTKPHDRDA